MKKIYSKQGLNNFLEKCSTKKIYFFNIRDRSYKNDKHVMDISLLNEAYMYQIILDLAFKINYERNWNVNTGTNKTIRLTLILLAFTYIQMHVMKHQYEICCEFTLSFYLNET